MSYEFDEKIVECWITAEADKLKLLRFIIKDTAEFIGVDAVLTKDLVLAVNEACLS